MGDNADVKIGFIGNNVTSILFGVYLAIAFQNLRLLLRNGQSRRGIFLLYALLSSGITIAYYTVYVLRLTPVYIGVGDERGDADFYSLIVYNLPLFLLFLANAFLADGLLVYRCFIIWTGQPKALIAPCLFFTVSIMCGVLSIFGELINIYAMLILPQIYMFTSMLLNLLVTVMICTKILRYRSKAIKVMGKQPLDQYMSTSAMLVESAVMYSAAVTAVSICWYINQPLLYTLLPMLSLVQVISPALILFRVASGSAFTAKSFDFKTTIVYRASTTIADTDAWRHEQHFLSDRVAR